MNMYTGVGKSKFVVHMEEDIQVMIITLALLTQKDVTCNCKPTFAHLYLHIIYIIYNYIIYISLRTLFKTSATF